MTDFTQIDLKSLEHVLSQLSVEDRAEIERLAVEELSKPFIPNPGPQTMALISDADILLFGGQAGGGKGLALETPIPTPAGFTQMGDLRTGDLVFDQDGNLCHVTAVSEVNHRPCFEVEFDDGTIITTDDVHRWLTMTAKDRERAAALTDEWRSRRRASRPSRAVEVSKKPGVSATVTLLNRERVYSYIAPPAPSVRETAEIAASVRVGRAGRVNHSVSVAQAIEGATIALPIEPYLLGLWLGDGFSASGAIGMMADDWEHILHHVAREVVSRKDATQRAGNKPFHLIRFAGLAADLRATGLRLNKHIPAQYLRASIEQRRELLRGLLDTDGSCDARGRIEIGLSNRRLAEDVQELICGLGFKTAISTKPLSQKSANWADNHRMVLHLDFPAFKLPRKAVRQRAAIRPSTRSRYITAVRSIPSVPTKCIAVDSPSRTYLVGRTFIPTHNSALEVGCAALDHRDGMIFRREGTQLDGLIKFSREVFSRVEGADFNSTEKIWKWGDGRTLKFAGLPQADDWRKHAGNARDYYAFDEAGEFLKEQIFSLAGWLRSTFPEQRCRMILGSNPPRGADGQWMLEEFAPWLDPLFPNPAKPGELRWAIMVGGITEWVDGPGEYERNGETYTALSRTFIPSTLEDNPYYGAAYRAQLQNLPEPLRSQLLKGDFLAGRIDDEWQVIPSEWIAAAQARWPGEPKTPMRAIGNDVAQGGPDDSVIAPLHDGNHFASLKKYPGKATPDGATMAGLVMKDRRDNASVGVDTTGGWGGSTVEHLTTHNDVQVIKIVFSAAVEGIDKKTGLAYKNLRAKMYWEFRNALDPESGENVILPPDKRVAAQLAIALWRPESGKIQIESKEGIKSRLGVSPDDADAIVIAWHIRNRWVQQHRAKKLTPPKAPPTGRGRTGWMGR